MGKKKSVEIKTKTKKVAAMKKMNETNGRRETKGERRKM